MVVSFADLGFRFQYLGASEVQSDNAFGLALLYMHARHYGGILGRFLQPDPARADSSLFAYAANSPITKHDPSGLITYNPTAPIGPDTSQLNPLEKEFCANPLNVLTCFKIGDLRYWAFVVTRQRYHIPAGAFIGRDGAPWNAFLHCCWSGAMAAELGRATAAYEGVIHERGDKTNDPRQSAVDQWNNRVGIEFGTGLKPYRAWNPHGMHLVWTAVLNHISNLCWAALHAGKLHYLSSHPS